MISPIACKLAVIGWLVFIAIHDWRTWTVAPWSTWPVIASGCLVQAWRGAWAPLALFVLYFAWDTTRADLCRLLRVDVVEGDEDRWLLPDPLAYAITGLLIYVAISQGQASLVLTAGFALLHLAWRLGRLPGGDCVLVIALLAIFPSLRFVWVGALVVALVTIPRLAWKYRLDGVHALRIGFMGGPAMGLAVLRAAMREKARVEPVAYVFSLAGIAGALCLW